VGIDGAVEIELPPVAEFYGDAGYFDASLLRRLPPQRRIDGVGTCGSGVARPTVTTRRAWPAPVKYPH
jgi:hypothetical protein